MLHQPCWSPATVVHHTTDLPTTPILFLTHRQFVKDFHILMQQLPPLPPAANMTTTITNALAGVSRRITATSMAESAPTNQSGKRSLPSTVNCHCYRWVYRPLLIFLKVTSARESISFRSHPSKCMSLNHPHPFYHLL